MNNDRRLLASGLCLVLFVLLATLNSAGYRYGASDQAFYVPAILDDIDPALFPRDSELLEAQARLTLADETVAALADTSGASLPALAFLLYLLALAMLALAALGLSRLLYRSPWSGVALLAALTLRHAIAKSGTNTLEGYFHPRQVAFGLGALAIVAFLRGSMVWPIAFVAVAALVHPTTAMWFVVWLVVAAFAAERRLRIPIAAGSAAAVALAGWALLAGPLAGRLITMDPAWLATLSSKDYLFPLAWPAGVWLINLAYAPIILWVFLRRRAAGLVVERETAVVAGCLSLLVVFAAALPFQARHVALAIQLQPARVFWMLDFIAVVYVVWALAEGASPSRRRAAIVAVMILAASAGRSAYAELVAFPERPIAQIDVPRGDWARAMAWARSSDPASHWLADPMHAVRYGTSVRVAGHRDVLVEEVKDTALGIYERSVAMRTRDRLDAVGNFARLTPDLVRELARRYRLDYMVTEQRLDLPLVFRSGRLRIYGLRPAPGQDAGREAGAGPGRG